MRLPIMLVIAAGLTATGGGWLLGATPKPATNAPGHPPSGRLRGAPLTPPGEYSPRLMPNPLNRVSFLNRFDLVYTPDRRHGT
jgi:hypothetical protein